MSPLYVNPVPKSLYDANSVLAATVDDTPVALTVGASTVVGRKAAGGIAAMTPAETKTVLAIAVGDVSGAAPTASPTFSGTVTLGDTVDLAVNTGTGSKIGTGSTQKLGFFGATPVAQIAGNVDVLAGLVTLGLRAASSNPALNLGTGAVTAGGTSSFATATFSGTAQTGFLTNVGNTGAFLSFVSNVCFVTQRVAGSAVLTVKGASGQSAAPFTVTDNSDNILMSVGPGGSITLADAANLVGGSSTGMKIGTATSQKIGFFNATPIIQPVGAGQAAVATTGAVNVAPFGYTTAAQADAIVTLVNALRTALVNLGLIKGAA